MLVTLRIKTDTGNTMEVSHDLKKFADVAAFGRKIEQRVKAIRKALPEMMAQEVKTAVIGKE